MSFEKIFKSCAIFFVYQISLLSNLLGDSAIYDNKSIYDLWGDIFSHLFVGECKSRDRNFIVLSAVSFLLVYQIVSELDQNTSSDENNNDIHDVASEPLLDNQAIGAQSVDVIGCDNSDKNISCDEKIKLAIKLFVGVFFLKKLLFIEEFHSAEDLFVSSFCDESPLKNSMVLVIALFASYGAASYSSDRYAENMTDFIKNFGKKKDSCSLYYCFMFAVSVLSGALTDMFSVSNSILPGVGCSLSCWGGSFFMLSVMNCVETVYHLEELREFFDNREESIGFKKSLVSMSCAMLHANGSWFSVLFCDISSYGAIIYSASGIVETVLAFPENYNAIDNKDIASFGSRKVLFSILTYLVFLGLPMARFLYDNSCVDISSGSSLPPSPSPVIPKHNSINVITAPECSNIFNLSVNSFSYPLVNATMTIAPEFYGFDMVSILINKSLVSEKCFVKCLWSFIAVNSSIVVGMSRENGDYVRCRTPLFFYSKSDAAASGGVINRHGLAVGK